jgi:hypothetical protein
VKRLLAIILALLPSVCWGQSSSRIPPAMNYVNARDFGAVPNDGNDDAAKIQAAIDAAITRELPCYLPPGDYNISEPVFVTGTTSKTSAASFYTATLYGAGCGISGNRTNIVPSFVNRPALVVNMAREVVIRDLAITGSNDEPATGSATQDETYANYVDADHRDSRYSPQCAIAIDATVGTAPADGGYPAMTYIGNVASGSNIVRLKNLAITKHVVGVIVRPDGQNAQNDEVRIDDCQITECALCYAVCNSQSRTCANVTNCGMSSCHTIVDTLRYGAQSGQCPSFNNLQGGACYRFVRMSSSVGTANFSGVYLESIKEIGVLGVGGASSATGACFTGCQFQFDYANGRPPFAVAAGLPVDFLGCNFQAVDGTAMDVFNLCGNSFFFAGCTIGGADMKFIGYSQDTATKTKFVNCLKQNSGGVRYLGFPLGGFSTTTIGPRLEPERSDRFLQTEDGLYIYLPGNGAHAVADAGSSYSLVGSTLTFTAADATLYQVGDYLLASCKVLDHDSFTASVPAFRVTVVSGSDITAVAFIDTTRIVAAPTVSRICAQEWAPGQSLTATTASASTTISSLSPTTIIAAGDWIKGEAGIAANTRVVSVNAGAGTAVLNKAATANGSTSLYYGKLHLISQQGMELMAATTAASQRTELGINTETNNVAVLEQKNAAGSGVVSLPYVNSNDRTVFTTPLVSSGLGTAGAPAYSFAADPDTGTYSPFADQWAVAVGGSQKIAVTGSTVTLVAASLIIPSGFTLSNAGTMFIDSTGGATVVNIRPNSTQVAEFSTTALTMAAGKDIVAGGNVNLSTAGALTVASGAVTSTKSYHTIAGEGAANDDLVTINGSTTGDILVIRAVDSAVTITVKDGTGNIQCAGDRALDNAQDTMTLIYDGTNWLELDFADNGA